MISSTASQAEKIEGLRRALETYRPGASELFDHEAEEAAAPVRAKALTLLSHRDRSRFELRSRLLDAEFEEAVVEHVLEELTASGLIDDARFAFEWVRQRHQRRGKAPAVLDQELIAKGIDSTNRAQALAQIQPEDEEATARALVEKKAASVKIPPQGRAEYMKALRRVVGVVARRGFEHELCMRVAQEALDSRIAQLETEEAAFG